MMAYQGRQDAWKSVIAVLYGPVLGLVYIIALPFIAIGTVVVLLVRKVAGVVVNLISNLVVFEWRPSETYLTGKKKGKKKEKQKTDPPETQ